MRFPKRVWKPVQIGIKLNTTSVMGLVEKLHCIFIVKYILTAKFMQSALENLLSQKRGQDNPHPQAVQFRQALRLVCLDQFMMVPASPSYEEDDTPQLLDFIKKYDMMDVYSEVAPLDDLANLPSIIQEVLFVTSNVC